MIKKSIVKPKKAQLVKGQTRVNYEQTISEIQKYLVLAGAKKITFDYDDVQLPCAITFCYQHKAGLMFFALPLRFNGIYKILKEQKVTNHTGDLQAINTGWRIMKDWILAQLALVDAEIAELPEIFLPYSVTPSGDTLWESVNKMDNPPFKLLS